MTRLGRSGAVAFATTHWSVVLTAQGESRAAREALEKLCRIYWPPIYSFVRRQGYSVEDAQDLTQGFFARFLERGDFDAARREKGRLRSYLLASLKHFLANERGRATAIKRGEGRALIPLHELVARAHDDSALAETLTADRIYERRWALTVLAQIISRLKDEYRRTGKAALFERFEGMLADEPEGISHAKIASEVGMTENAVKQAYHRFRQRYRELLREEVAHTVAVPGDIENELKHLVAVLRE